jgi:hypothetical protein
VVARFEILPGFSTCQICHFPAGAGFGASCRICPFPANNPRALFRTNIFVAGTIVLSNTNIICRGLLNGCLDLTVVTYDKARLIVYCLLNRLNLNGFTSRMTVKPLKESSFNTHCKVWTNAKNDKARCIAYLTHSNRMNGFLIPRNQ